MRTFGCQMNAAESARLARMLTAGGFRESTFEDAGIYILNTCAVRDKPEQKVYSELGRIAEYCKAHGKKDALVCVGGCVARRAGDRIMQRFPQVRLLFGDGVAGVAEALTRLTEDRRLRISLSEFSATYEECPDPLCDPAQRDAFAVPPSVFVDIMQGCDNFCAYCIVPFTRGRQKSRKAENILRECRTLVAGGAREITLLGQNVNAYGLDGGGGGTSFAGLLRGLSTIPGLRRLRFVTSHPKDLAPEVVEQFGDNPVLCPRLHLPVQSGSDAILKAMKRRYDTAAYLDLVDRLRTARPDIALTTDMIVGFPGETDADFEDSMRLLERVSFASAFSFVYSDRPGTRAAGLPDKVERSAALERLARLQAYQDKVSQRLLQTQVGSDCVVLLEGRSRMPKLLQDSNGSAENFGSGAFSDGSGEAPRAYFSQLQGVVSSGNGDESGCAGNSGNGVPSGSGGGHAGASWVGRTPHGFIVNVVPEDDSDAPFTQGGLLGAMLPVRIESAAHRSLKGRQAGRPC
ncbi:MAG: tRNA (N6-isopentenyl adenosine(37)-C2)-methylthiotransferase MiaB [Desulfovibrio sp.]|jgi:tRNA-2-methylthio-N6-dimethylallyladenosine synthase|nr:tRNA (N6-isopentenyl adenosine(37)-C2)-methylthiotransferase MiaB [Desulfovibrio sp.]